MCTHRSDAGFSLAAVIFFATAMSILIAAAVPVYQMQAKRQMEEELIFRGEEYTRAIQKYQRRFGVYPISVDQLLSTNGLRFLRRKYEDPITGKDFRLITVNPDGSLNGSKVFLQTPNGQQLFGNTSAFPSGTGAPNTNSNATPNTNSNPRPGGTSGGFMGTTNFGATNSGGTSFSFGAAPTTAPNATVPNFGGGSAAGPNPTRPASGAAAPGTFMGYSTSVAGVNQGLGGSARNGQTFGSSGIVGVASDSDQASIKIYNNRQRYDEWEFIALFGAAAGVPGASGNPNANGVNSNFPGAAPGGNNFGGNRGANNPGANGFRSTNPFGGAGFNTPSPFGQTGTPFGAGPGTSPGTQTPFGVPTPQQQQR